MGFEFSFAGDKYVLATLSTFIFVYGGYPFLKGLYDEVKDNGIGMMTLIGVAITVAWAYSVAITFGLQGMDFYWEMATLIDIMLIGHYFEMKSVLGASRSLELNEALCFVSSSVLADSLVLRNRQLLVAANIIHRSRQSEEENSMIGRTTDSLNKI